MKNSQINASMKPRHAAFYLRENSAKDRYDGSIPDQRQKLTDYCAARGLSVVAEFSDRGSGSNPARPGLQRMMDVALRGDAPFDVILVHSYSRFFRDQIEAEMRIRLLEKHGIRLISITQEFEDTPGSEMSRRITAIFDEYTSKETGKHVSRAMADNARQGYFSGGKPPYGFEAVEVEKRGKTIKKKLEPKADEDETVRQIFRLYSMGDGSSGPLGVKKVTAWLNEHGYRTRGGARWGIGQIHKILTDPVYKGDYQRRTNSAGAETEIIHIPVPQIVPAETFDAVQLSLASRNPKATPPRLSR